MSAMAAAKMQRGGGGGGERAAPSAFVHICGVLPSPGPFLGGYWVTLPMALPSGSPKLLPAGCTAVPGGLAARGRGVPGPRRGAPWPGVPARKKEYLVLSLK